MEFDSGQKRPEIIQTQKILFHFAFSASQAL